MDEVRQQVESMHKAKKVYRFKLDLCTKLPTIPQPRERNEQLAETTVMLACRHQSLTMCSGISREDISAISDQLEKAFRTQETAPTASRRSRTSEERDDLGWRVE